VAVLGLNNQKSARSVARLLLADALSDEGAWERQLEEFAVDDRRGIILRYPYSSLNERKFIDTAQIWR